jgi:hypothetical protein
MKKIFLVIAMVVSSFVCAIAQDQANTIQQKDIDEFLSFADDYKTISEKFIKNAKNKSISEIFYTTDNSRWAKQSDIILKKAGWTFDKMNQFLYTVYLALLAINYSEMYGDVSKQEGGNLFEDVPESVKQLVKKNHGRLDKYFPKEDYAAYADSSDAASAEVDSPKDSNGTPDDSEVEVIHGDIKLDVAVDSDIKVDVVFESGADELVMRTTILKAGKEIAKGAPKTVKPWTMKGGHVEYTWSFAKKDLKKGPYAAAISITDKDGFEVGLKTVEFAIK